MPHKEGEVRAHADIEEFLDGRKRAVLLDNNVLASEWGLMQIEKIVRMGIRVDFNQGLDARRIARTPEIAALLARVKWIRFLRMAYDSRAMQDDVHKAIELLRKHGVPARKLFLYVLIRDDTEDALGRIRELKALGCQPFAQPYRDFEHEGKPSREQWRLAYWCNRKPLFYSVDYEEYRKTELNNRTYEQTENQICRRVRLSCSNGGRAYRIAICGLPCLRTRRGGNYPLSGDRSRHDRHSRLG